MNKETNKKALLNIEEFSYYLGIGKTKARELLKDPFCTYCVKIGNRTYAHKRKLDIWLDVISGN